MTETPRDDMNGSILCGVDGSSESRAALRVASQLSGQLDLRLIVANVVPVPIPGPRATRTMVVTATEPELQAAATLLEQIRRDEGAPDAEHRVASGVPAEALADLADDEDAALIVVGSRGRGAFRAAFLGSTSTDLIGIARRPVLVVPPGAVEAAAALAERE